MILIQISQHFHYFKYRFIVKNYICRKVTGNGSCSVEINHNDVS